MERAETGTAAPQPEHMRAVRFGGVATGLVVEDVPVPRPGPDDVVVEVAACGLCGSDVHFLEGMPTPAPLPLTLGHEPAGTIVSIGERVQGWQVGDPVAISIGVGCGTCRTCQAGAPEACPAQQAPGLHLDGAFAEFIRVPAATLVRIPPGVSMPAAAVATDCVASPYHALVCRARLQPGEQVVVIGVGGLGSMAVTLARLLGAAHVVAVDTSPAALERAARAGAATTVLIPEGAAATDVSGEVRSATGGGADVTLECVGHPDAASLGVLSLRPAGRLVLIGVSLAAPPIPYPQALFALGEYEVIGSFASHQADITAVLDLAATGRLDIDSAISHRVTLEEVPAGYERLRLRHGDPQRIVMVRG